MKEKLIRFQGKEYLLIGSMEDGGPIATKEQYENGQLSYAQLSADGAVMRFGDSIGHRDEIEVLGECEVELTGKHLLGLLTDESWGWKRD